MPRGATCRRSLPGAAQRPVGVRSYPGGSCLACAVVVAVTLGCGTPAARLTGSVTAGGAPAAGARIDARSGEGARQRVATGAVLPDGTYRVDYGAWPGLEPGPCRIEITHVAGASGQPLATGEQGLVDAAKATARHRHMSFERSLVAGENTVDFELDDGAPIETR